MAKLVFRNVAMSTGGGGEETHSHILYYYSFVEYNDNNMYYTEHGNNGLTARVR